MPQRNTKTNGPKIIELREKAGKTQYELADHILGLAKKKSRDNRGFPIEAVNKRTIENAEAGKNLTWPKIRAIAFGLGVDPEALILPDEPGLDPQLRESDTGSSQPGVVIEINVFISHSSADQGFVEQTLIPLLKKNGIEPWYSKNDIRTGDAWERKIVQSLETCNWFLVVMSPNAAKSDWVKTEVDWAIQNRAGRLVPVMISSCESQSIHLQLRRLQHVDFRQDITTATRKLLEAFGKEQDRPRTDSADAPSHEVVNFTAFIEERTRAFLSGTRGFVFDAIRDFQNQHSSGYFVIEGDPGSGKSTVLAQYVKQRGCIYHFNIRREGRNRVDDCLRNICAQVTNRHGLADVPFPTDSTRYANHFAQTLEKASAKVAPKEGIVIAIDALDEVDTSSQSPGQNILYLPTSLPSRVHVVLTTRHKRDLRLFTQSPQDGLDFSRQCLEQTDEDIRRYIRTFIDRPKVRAWMEGPQISAGEFVETLATKSERNFMYLAFVLPAIERGKYENLEIKDLPVGLRGYYNEHWQRMNISSEPEKIRIVYSICAFRRPISAELLAELAGLTGDKEHIVHQVIDDWYEFLHEDVVKGKRHYSVYHASFQDFLYEMPIVKIVGHQVVSGREMAKNTDKELGLKLYSGWKKKNDGESKT